MITLEKKNVYSGGIEGHLNALSIWLCVVGIASFIGYVILFFAETSTVEIGYLNSRTVYNWSLLGNAVEFLLIGLFFGIISSALANLIRLQKKAQGMPFSGKISEPSVDALRCCSQCGTPAYPGQTRCHHCHEDFQIS